ncbi:hypothetical protein [Hydrocarboniphaga sp.]|uniref:hypothetical protein n=1 Tax=Hydrocarboniphaga sp. TaxID=2033016 RepID=UPI003D0D8C10
MKSRAGNPRSKPVFDRDPGDRQTRAQARLAALLAHARCGRGARDQALIDGLFLRGSDAGEWLAGISELSMSYRQNRAPTVRALAEVIRKRPADAASLAALRGWGLQQLQRASDAAGAPYGGALFESLFDAFYDDAAMASQPALRFGIATEFGCASPVVKTYFDLHATPTEQRGARLDEVAALLRDEGALADWKRACPASGIDAMRVIGVDFGAGGVVRSKFYWGARSLGWDAIVAASQDISGERHLPTLQRLRREVEAVGEGLSTVMVSICSTGGQRAIKLDVCIARLYDDDLAALDALQRFRGRDFPAYDDAAFRIVSGGLPAQRTRRIHQYLGVELPADGGPRMTVYYRPIGLDTEHLGAPLRPQISEFDHERNAHDPDPSGDDAWRAVSRRPAAA